jgi:hypothetical protein
MEHVLGARNAGAIDFLVKPISMKRIVERVMNAVTNPRPFIVSPEYVGPERRGLPGQGEELTVRPDGPLPEGTVVLPPDALLLAKVRGDEAAIREARERRADANGIVTAAVAAMSRAAGRTPAASGPVGAAEVPTPV